MSAGQQATWEMLKCFFISMLGIANVQKPGVLKSRQSVIGWVEGEGES